MPRPARPWFRTYSETLENEKAHALGLERPDLFFRQHQLQCLANITEPRGYLPNDVIKIAFAMRVDTAKATEIINELKARRFIDLKGRRLYIHDWHDWNPDSDANLTKARAKRNQRTPKERAKNGERTPLERLEKEKEEEKEKEKEPEGDKNAERGFVVPVHRAFERCFGRLLSPMEIEEINALDDEHPRERIDYALREASELNKRSVRYIKAICENQASNGDNHDSKPQRNGVGNAATQPQGITAAEAAQIERWGIGRSEFVLDPDGVDSAAAVDA